MKFLVDAQLPRRLAARLREAGHDVLHTLDLPDGNRTTDATISTLSVQEQRAVVTKDADFVDEFLLRRQPYKLVLVSTGNISNNDLDALLVSNLDPLTAALEGHDFVELSRNAIIVHS
jgi:predicted nuclease of predicted toxin-antitoxin system